MVRLHCPPKRAGRRDACEQGVPRLISEPTRPLKVSIDACCGVAPERSLRSNQCFDLGGRQLDPLIAQRRQCVDRITQEFQTVFLVGHQATDDQLNGFKDMPVLVAVARGALIGATGRYYFPGLFTAALPMIPGIYAIVRLAVRRAS